MHATHIKNKTKTKTKKSPQSPAHTTLSVRIRANIKFGVLKIKV